ncbi:MAG TPA: ABC transporter permease [Acidobacteriaceae bacterium]|jgi:putative ABC transport system permease protein|nr:ABC transporter permease [Acidobacteriaceae bacterium]
MKGWPLGKKDADLERELRADLDLEEEEQRERGLSQQDAHDAARRAFGNPTLIREQTRAVWAWNRLESLTRDLRYGVRTLGRSPGFTLIAIVVMALGIGANVALFTVVHSVLLKPLPYRNPGRLALLYEADNSQRHASPWLPVDAGSFWDWQRSTQSLAQMAMLSPFQGYNVSAEGGKLPEVVEAAWCTNNFLSLLGVQPMLGRAFTADDDRPGAPATAIITAGFWKRRYASDPAIAGKTIWLDAKPYTIIGVLPPTFVYSGAFGGNADQVWTPVSHEAPAWLLKTYGDHEFQVVARLAPGVSLTTLASRLVALQRQIKAAHPDPAVHPGVIARSILDDAVHNYKTPLYALLAATGCVLLIACMNVAGLLVARAAARSKEFAIRTALGGGRMRLIRERLIESLLLSVAGGALGLLLAWGSLQWLMHARTDMNRVEAIRFDLVAAAFTVGVIVLCALFSGLISALSSGRGSVLAGLQESGRSSSSGRSRALLRRGLLTLEVALTVVLLSGAGLLLRSFERLRSSDLGVPTRNVLTLRLGLPDARYGLDTQKVAFFERLIESVRALPGVSAAGLVSAAPGEGWNGDNLMSIVEHPPLPKGQGLDFMLRGADPGYFAAIGLPILQGRTFQQNERLDRANVVLISRGAAQLFFPGENPIGQHVREINGSGVWQVIGVVGDVRWNIAQPPNPTLYWPIYGNGYSFATIVVRAPHDVESLAVPIQKAVAQLDPDLPVSSVMTLREAIGKSTIDSAFDSVLVVAFAIIALILAAAGLYGVLAYLAEQRRVEFGIRLALGAQRNALLSLLLFDGLKPALLGLLIGLPASAALVRLIQSMLYQTQPFDPLVFGAVAGLLLFVAIAACLAPAWSAARLDPIKALRTE